MDRAYLALVQQRLKEYELALKHKVTAEAEGIAHAHATEVAEKKLALLKALNVWRVWLGVEPGAVVDLRGGDD